VAAVRVWTERRPVGSWDQCSECGYLMAMVYGGFDRFAHGAYSDTERDALTAAERDRAIWRAAGNPMFPLIDEAARTRYGVRLRRIPDGTRTGLKAKLQTPGIALSMAGNYAHLGPEHDQRLRRWQPGFAGGHMICVVPQEDGRLLWLDPLAERDFGGDLTDVETALAFAYIPSDAHEATIHEFGQAVREMPMIRFKAEGWKTTPAGAQLFDGIDGPKAHRMDGDVAVTTIGESMDGDWRYVLATRDGQDRWYAVRRTDLDPLVPGGDAAFSQAIFDHLLKRKA
jgi:hypothetical protein